MLLNINERDIWKRDVDALKAKDLDALKKQDYEVCYFFPTLLISLAISLYNRFLTQRV